MKHRAIKNLLQLRSDAFIEKVSEGLGKIYESCDSLYLSFSSLVNNKEYQAARIIESVLKEEAAKFLILIDAIRCPVKHQKTLSRQLEKFNDHLAKGIYAKMCNWSPDKYSTLCGYIQDELKDYYLDDPEGVEWIFRNSIISSREESMYVDYVEYEENKNTWLTPQRFDDIGFGMVSHNAAVERVKALYLLGVCSVASLKVFSKYWQDFEFSNESHYQDFKKANSESLELLDKKGLIKDAPESCYSLIINEMPFPVYKEPMKMDKVSLNDLKETQNNWSPE